jgi:RNA polymerase sigma-70 factor (ECF subfamily)
VDQTQRSRTFDEVAMPHLDAAYNLARWLCGNAEDAEDVTQEACMRAFRFIEGFRGGDARAWLLRIVRNTCYSRWRSERNRPGLVEFDEDLHGIADEGVADASAANDPESLMLGAERVRLLDRALASLPEDFREALVLRELESLSYKEIAESLEIPIGTVMSRISRARRLLVGAYKRLAGEDDGLLASPSAAHGLR